MPIKGLTDRASIKARFPRLGKLRKGDEKPATGNKPGQELPYWRFVTESADVQAAFEAVYGDKPRLVNVYLPYATLEENFETWKEEWKAGGLVHRCDGETCVISRKNGGYSTEPKPCPGGCQQVGRLTVVIPELVQAGFIGTVTMVTSGTHDLIAIPGVLKGIEDEQERRGLAHDLRGIPFSLVRIQEEVSAPGWGENAGKRVRVKKWNVKIWPHRDMAREMLMSAEPVAALAAGHVDFETGEIIEHDEPDYEDTQESTGPTMDEISAAMLAVGPSGEPLGKFDRLVWGKVASAKGDKYSADLKAKAKLLFENQNLVMQWRTEYGSALDDIAAQDALADDDIPPEAY